MRILGINNITNFQRRPTKQEEPDLKATINKAYDLMKTKERAVITHGSCFPSGYRDTFIGSPYSQAAKEYIKFLSLYGFNSNQLGPVGELQKTSISPYNSSAFAKNRLFIDLEELTKDKYGNILSKETFEQVTNQPDTDKNYDLTDFTKARKTYDTALAESFKNFKINMINGKTPELRQEFIDFMSKNGTRLNDEAVFNILADEYGTDDFSKWHNKLDENLISVSHNGNPKAFERYKELSVTNSRRIEQYKFEQFIAAKQIKENKQWRDSIGFKYINDLLVGCSKMDEWRYKDAFLPDWEMGAREYNSPSQRWHIPVLDPKKIFLNENYDLNIGGEFLKEKINFALEFCENIRVDHVLGLIEPYLMSKHASDEEFNTGSVKNNDIELYISDLKDSEGNEYDAFWDYPKLIKHLVLPLLEEHGITKDMPVWEDICSYPDRFKMIYKELKLPRITFSDWEKAEDTTNEPENWSMLGNHDNMPVMNYLKRKDNNGNEYTKNQSAWNPLYLAGYLNQDPKRANERNTYCEKIANDDRELVFAKFSELMTTPKFQISFDDLLGITDITYNIPGKKGGINWRERITADFLDKYYENLSSETPTALNIPELLKQSLQAKIDMEAKDLNEAQRSELYSQSQPVLDKLEYYANILKEA